MPQGSVIGSLLGNLVLNDLDQFVEKELSPQFNKGKERKKNPEYRRLSYAMTKARREENTQLYRQLKKQRQQLPNRDPYDPHFRRLKYVRYCDDFLLGYAGTRQEAVEIKQRIQEFLSHQLKLTLSEEKTLVTHATNGCGRFLNYEIYIGLNNTKLTNNKKNAKRVGRSLNGKVILSVPQDVTAKWQTRFNRNGKATHRPYLLHCSDYEIIQTYGLEFQGLVNYYTMAHNVAKRLYPVKYHFQQSLVKTLAAKHKKSVTWVYRRYSRKSEHGVTCLIIKVSNPNNPAKQIAARFGDKPIRYNPKAFIRDRIAQMYHGGSELIRRLLANKCELCGSSEGVDVHHVKKLKDIKKKYRGRSEPPAWAKFMMARNRKTVVVCHQCHVSIHNGRYDQRKVE